MNENTLIASLVFGLWSSIGSANFDNRSFKLNDECNFNVLDARFTSEQETVFDQDLKKSQRITYDQWRARPFHEKVADFLADLFSPLL